MVSFAVYIYRLAFAKGRLKASICLSDDLELLMRHHLLQELFAAFVFRIGKTLQAFLFSKICPLSTKIMRSATSRAKPFHV